MDTAKKSRGLAAVTGSSRGLGKAIALELACCGYDLVLISRKSTDLDNTADQIRRTTNRLVKVRYADLLDEQECVGAVKDEPIDVLVNCGIYQGPGMNDRIDSLVAVALKNNFQANVLTQIALARAVLPGMIQRKRGRIFQLVSSSSRIKPTKPVNKGGFQAFAYTASKAAISKMVPILRVEHADDANMFFFNIDPGLVITDKMKAEGSAEKFAKWGAVPAELTAKIVAFFCDTDDLGALMEWNGAEYIDAPQLYKRITAKASL